MNSAAVFNSFTVLELTLKILRQTDSMETPRIENFGGDGLQYFEFEAGRRLPQAEIAANRALD